MPRAALSTLAKMARHLRRGLVLSVAAVLGLSLIWYVFAPKPELIPDWTHSKAFYARDGQLLRLTLSHDQQYRLWQSLDNIPKEFQQATLLYEDQYFYRHPGVNPIALLRATYSSYFSGGRRMGASTITMQLARLRFGLTTNTVSGKFEQIKTALRLERHYSKNEILEAYLNLAPYGHNIQGVGAASLVYFHKPATQLTTTESLLLAVVPQNPNSRVPSSPSGYEQAISARERLIDMWSREFDLDAHNKKRLALPLHVFTPGELPYRAPHFVESVLKQDSVSQHALNEGIHTSLDLGLQSDLENIAASYINQTRTRGLKNTAVMILDHRTMEIVAELGSVDYFDNEIQGQVNGTRALRSPGSTLKPFIYALGLEQGLIHPNSLLKDAPKRFGAYTPENYDQQFAGPLSATDALVKSRNIPAVRLMQRLNTPDFHAWLKQSSPQRLEPADHYGLSLALGGNEVSMLELVQWYAMLANLGEFQTATSLRNDANVLENPDSRKPMTLLSPQASFLSLDMLSQNPSIHYKESIKNLQSHTRKTMPIPWKTGTSYAFRDAWSIGLVGHYVVAVWVGNFDGSGNPALVGRRAAAPLFFKIATQLQHREPRMFAHWNTPNRLNLSKLAVCKTSGDLDVEHCPEIISAWFIPGVSPIKSSNIYREVLIDIASQLRACEFDPVNTEKKVFEFWPSDIQAVFKQAGLKTRTPPPFLPECNQQNFDVSGDAPQITSPMPNLDYALQSDRLKHERIPLTAIAESDSSTLYWFVENKFIGSASPSDPLLWTPDIGKFDVTVIDDLGRSGQVSVKTTLVN